MNFKGKKSKFARTMAVTLASVLGLSALAACSPFGNNAGVPTEDTERTLRIATMYSYGPDDSYFRQQYTELFEFANQNITIEIVPAIDYNSYYYDPSQQQEQKDPMEELKKLMQGDNPPDLVMVDFNQLPDLINENLLMPLDPLITADQFDTSKIVPTVLEGIKGASTDGRIYAMAPLFSSSALYFNRAIFNEASVPYPEDGMTWEQIFNLARQVSGGQGEDAKHGFSFTNYSGGDIFWEMQMYTQPLQLRYFDASGEKMTVDSDQWEEVWRTMIELRQSGVFPPPPNYDQPMAREPGPYDWDNFISGRLAMTISGYYYINELIQANRIAQTNDKVKSIDWDVVTIPTHPQAPETGGQIYFEALMGINATAQNSDDAWKFLKFLNGDDWARLKSRSQSSLVSNKEYLQPKEGLSYNIEAFYQLKPMPMQDDSQIYRKYPNIYMVQSIGQQKWQEVLNGDKEIRQALKEWQTEGDAMLQQMRENPQQMPGWGGEPLPIDITPVETFEETMNAEVVN